MKTTSTQAINPTRLAKFDTLFLGSGEHNAPHDRANPSEASAMEMAAWLANEPWSDSPECVSPVIASFVIGLNDSWDNDQRQRLKPFIPRVIGTRGSLALDEIRSYMAFDWLIRTYTPAWLDLANLNENAKALRDLPEVVDLDTVVGANFVISAASSAARSAAGWAALSAAYLAAYLAASSADSSEAYLAASLAASSAAYLAASLAASSADSSAASSVLASTVTKIQVSALELLDRMINAQEPADHGQETGY